MGAETAISTGVGSSGTTANFSANAPPRLGETNGALAYDRPVFNIEKLGATARNSSNLNFDRFA